ncbi:histidine phosphatase family protein [Actinocorallia sp. A-T 12471]|uniref:histidine phosphatase family protein n=1 Tax=Actinocorallia sp. A-T 12471 TaxID=3089813 RepID=UPI0029CB13AE|nr:histidine phosphatase family protein [Actinocorallia sp. A-T 12471]MDX6743905.1 histidine phosphatase family protein [Actinocorallia sp. A-T 12471]
MPVIHLVRHAQASFGAADYDALSPIGPEQAAVVGRALAARKPRDPVIVAGTLVRQRDTARAVAEAVGAAEPVGRDARLNEYDFIDLVSGGAAEGLSGGADPQKALDRMLLSWIEQDSPDGWRAFSDGALAAVTELGERLGKGRDGVAVTSGGVIAAICGALLGLPPQGVVAVNRVMVNASVTTLLVGSTGVNLLTMNDHAHFTGDARDLLTYR